MLVIKNARIIDGTGKNKASRASIIIENGRISDIRNDEAIPKGADIINCEGLTAVPALIDAHTHFSGSSLFSRPPLGRREKTYDYAEAREACLRWGVLAIRTAGDLMPDIIDYREDVKAGKLISPRIICAGPMFQAKGGHPCYTVFMSEPEIEADACIMIDDDTDIESKVDAAIRQGVDWIKVFYAHINKMNYPVSVPRISKKALERIINAAHEKGKPVMVHVDDPAEMLDAAKLGADSIEHLIGVGAHETRIDEELISVLIEKNVTVVPTMVSILRFDGGLDGAAPVWEELKAAVKKLKDSGVPLSVGCDSGIPFVPHGEAVHDELKLLVEAGFTPMEAICAATHDNARLLKLDDMTGTLECGKSADIILLGSDPLSDISNTKDIRLVISEGRVVFDIRSK